MFEIKDKYIKRLLNYSTTLLETYKIIFIIMINNVLVYLFTVFHDLSIL